MSHADFIERDGVFDVNTESHHGCGAAVPVVAGVRHVLVVDRKRDTAPNVSGVICFEDLLHAVVQSAVAQNEPQASQRQIAPVVTGDPVGDECSTQSVLRTVPSRAAIIAANLGGPIDFGIGE